MLISIAGSQGSGKSTILNRIKLMGYNTIDRKTSRSILADWGVSLQEVNTNPELTMRFQEEITKRKHDDEKAAAESDQIWFTERTHADLFTYSLVSLGHHNEYSQWIDKYYTTCMEYNQIYDAVFYLRAGRFHVEHDGVRGSNHHYSRMVDIIMLDITSQMVHNSKLSVIETPDLDQRVQMITLQSQHL